jgi:hypothetical protein
MKLIKIFIYSALLWSILNSAFAESDCRDLVANILLKRTSVSRRIKVTLGKDLEVNADPMIKAIDDITKFSKGINTPDEITLDVWPAGQYINYDVSTNKLLTAEHFVVGELPDTFYKPGPQKWSPGPSNVKKSKDATMVITAHEYGHAILYENIILRSKKSRFDKVPYAQFKAERIQIKEDLATLYSELYKSSPTLIRKEELEGLINILTNKDSLLTGIGGPFSGSIKAYNEIFADVVAILFAKKGDAISDVIYDKIAFSHLSPAELKKYFRDNVLGRSFLHDYAEDNIEFSVSNSHSVLGKARSYLWNHGLRDELTKDNHSEFLKKVLKAIQEAVDDNFDSQKEFSSGAELTEHFLSILKKYIN